MPGKRICIGILANSLAGDYQSEVRLAIERAASERDVDVLFVSGQQNAAASSLALVGSAIYSMLGPERVDALIVLSGTLTHYMGVDGLERLCQSYAPLPVCSIGVELPGVPSLLVDNAAGMEVVVRHMLEVHQRRAPAYIGGPLNSDEAELRRVAYLKTLGQAGVSWDPRLLAAGDFSAESGAVAMRELLAHGVAFDVVVAANDYMALGALEVLKQHQLSVPRDVLVAGFDDVSVARFCNPSLTTVRQPLKRLGTLAVDTVLRQVANQRVPNRTAVAVELVRRESCGCGYQLTRTWAPTASDASGRAPALSERLGELSQQIRKVVAVPSDVLQDWPERFLDSLMHELGGEPGRFLQDFEHLLEAAQNEGVALDEFQQVITLLRSELPRTSAADSTAVLERIWHAARLLIGSASVRAQGRRRLDVEAAALHLARSGERLSTALSMPLLRQVLGEELPSMNIMRAAVALHDADLATLKPFFLMVDGREVETHTAGYPTRKLADEAYFTSEQRQSSFLMPLTFEDKQLGILLLSAGANETLYETLRHQIGSALKSAALHREVVQQTAARERVEQESLRQETRMAARLQTTLAPSELRVAGLEISALMEPASESGGDYYDVFPLPDGAFLAMGDVAGHGLAAGIIMVMIQSMVALLARESPAGSPAELLSRLNAALFDNVRHRLQRDEHATLVLMRYFSNGRVVFAGAHEDILVCRADSRRCERIATDGVWVAALPEIESMLVDAEFQLRDGDLVVLFTDGVTEALNVHSSLFGVERLCSLVEQAQDTAVHVIRDRILAAVHAWAPQLHDDVTLLVARYRGSADAEA